VETALETSVDADAAWLRAVDGAMNNKANIVIRAVGRVV
jgi:hypothetical protein